MEKQFFLAFVLFFLVSTSRAQIFEAEIGIDGFTCSMCALGVENRIRKLPYVEEVQMDLNKSIAVVIFRENRKISIQQVAERVYEAGFSVRYIRAKCDFGAISIEDKNIIELEGTEYSFLKNKEVKLIGSITVLFLNKRLISKKEYTHWERWIKEDIKKNGKSKRRYYVTPYYG